MRPLQGSIDGFAAASDEVEAARADLVDPDEARILRQSIPKEEVTRDFLQDLLNEHRAVREPARHG